jgi:hypothetical protein
MYNTATEIGAAGQLKDSAIRKEPQVMAELKRLETAVTQLDDSLQKLVKALVFVSRGQQPPNPATVKEPEQETLVEVAGSIRTQRMHIAHLNSIVLSTIDRLEV